MMAPVPPIAGMLWHCAQEVPLKSGPRPSVAVSTSRKSARPRRNSSRSRAVSPGSGAAGTVSCWARMRAARPMARVVTRRLFNDDPPPHEIVAGAAGAGAFEDVVTLFFRDESDANFAFTPLRNGDLDVGPRNPKAVAGV